MAQRACATTERWGRGEKPIPFIVREPTRPARRARARAHLRLSHSYTRALSLPPSASRMLREEGGVGAYGFLLSFPEKFLERRSSGEAGGWGGQGNERLREGKAKNPEHTATTLPPSSHDQSKAQAHRDPYARGKSKGTTATAPSCTCAQAPRPLTTGRRERAGGNDEKPKTLTGCLRGGGKADIRALELPAHDGPPAALRCALGCGLSALGSTWLLKEWSGALAPGSLVPPHLGASLITPFLSLVTWS